ncbi:MAG: hypothetical protein ACOC1O_00950 [bacterium]
MKITEKDLIRRMGGLSRRKKDLNEDHRVDTLTIENRVIQAFSLIASDLKRIKNQMEGISEYPSYHYQNREKMEVECNKIYSLAKEKLNIIEELIEDYFGKNNKKEISVEIETATEEE